MANDIDEVFKLDGKCVLALVKDKITKKETHKEYANMRIGTVHCTTGKPLSIYWKNNWGNLYVDECVIDIDENEYGFWIETTNKLWRFDYVYDTKNDENVIEL